MRDSIKKAMQKENAACNALTAAGFRPYGNPAGGVVVFWIENENKNDEKRKIYYFSTFASAAACLL